MSGTDPRSGDERVPTDKELGVARMALEESLEAVGISLDEPGLWFDSTPGGVERVVAVLGEPEAPGSTAEGDRSRRTRRWVAAAVGIAAVVAAAAIVAGTRSPGADWEVALAGTEAAPTAHAVARGWNEASGTRMKLDISGLQPAPVGFVYELWLSKGPVHVSAGTFHNSADAQLWVGVSRRDFPRVWVTLEPLNDDTGPAVNILDSKLGT